MTTARKAGLPERVPRAVLALCWALAAQHWKLGPANATYAGLQQLLGIASRTHMCALVNDAVRARVVLRKTVTLGGSRRPVVMLKKSTLTQLEALWNS